MAIVNNNNQSETNFDYRFTNMYDKRRYYIYIFMLTDKYLNKRKIDHNYIIAIFYAYCF